jgi:hypothetical protein
MFQAGQLFAGRFQLQERPSVRNGSAGVVQTAHVPDLHVRTSPLRQNSCD